MRHPLELVVLTGLSEVPPWPLGPEAFTVGRLSGCDWILRHASISRQHARFTPTLDGWQVEDLGSSNGTWLGGERLARPQVLSPGQALRLGDVVLLLRPQSLAAGSIPPGLRLVSRAQEYQLIGAELLIGRSAPCHLIVADPSVSRVHARIFWQEGVPYLTDSGSRNGTTLRGEPVTAPVPLAAGDRFSCGEVEVVVDAVLPAPVLWLDGVNLSSREGSCLAYRLRLDPGEAAVVPPGPHLPRLRSVLLGLAPPQGGSLLLGGEPLPGAAELLRRQQRLGYISHEPALLPDLTVEQQTTLPLAGLITPPEAGALHLRRAGLADWRATPVAELGLQERVRLGALLALATAPALLVVEAAAAPTVAERMQAHVADGGAVLVLGDFQAEWVPQRWVPRDGRLVNLYTV